MPRTKRSKNEPKVTDDFASQIAEKQESIASLTNEITSITANIDTLKASRPEREEERSQGRPEGADQELETKKAAADQKVAEEAKKNEAENLVKKLLAEGVSADDIIEKLK